MLLLNNEVGTTAIGSVIGRLYIAQFAYPELLADVDVDAVYQELEGFLEEDMGDNAGDFQGSSIEVVGRDQMEVFRQNAQKLHTAKGKRTKG